MSGDSHLVPTTARGLTAQSLLPLRAPHRVLVAIQSQQKRVPASPSKARGAPVPLPSPSCCQADPLVASGLGSCTRLPHTATCRHLVLLRTPRVSGQPAAPQITPLPAAHPTRRPAALTGGGDTLRAAAQGLGIGAVHCQVSSSWRHRPPASIPPGTADRRVPRLLRGLGAALLTSSSSRPRRPGRPRLPASSSPDPAPSRLPGPGPALPRRRPSPGRPLHSPAPGAPAPGPGLRHQRSSARPGSRLTAQRCRFTHSTERSGSAAPIAPMPPGGGRADAGGRGTVSGPCTRPGAGAAGGRRRCVTARRARRGGGRRRGPSLVGGGRGGCPRHWGGREGGEWG